MQPIKYAVTTRYQTMTGVQDERNRKPDPSRTSLGDTNVLPNLYIYLKHLMNVKHLYKTTL